MLTCYFGYFRHASQTPPKTIVATWRKLWYLSTQKRSTSPFTSFLRHYEPGFCQIRGLQWSKNTNVIFHIRLISGQANDKIFQKMQKMPFWAHFRPALSNFRQKKILFKILFLPAFLFYVSLYQISKKTNEQIPSNTGFRRTDTRTNKYEFISPFQIKPGVKKKYTVTKKSSQMFPLDLKWILHLRPFLKQWNWSIRPIRVYQKCPLKVSFFMDSFR